MTRIVFHIDFIVITNDTQMNFIVVDCNSFAIANIFTLFHFSNCKHNGEVQEKMKKNLGVSGSVRLRVFYWVMNEKFKFFPNVSRSLAFSPLCLYLAADISSNPC